MKNGRQGVDSKPLLFIPGACHGAWCWDEVLPFFNNPATGSARAMDLPQNPQTASLAGQAKAILAQIDRPTILVAHSAGGFAATAAAIADPARVAGVIYVCAYVPRDGHSLAMMVRAQAVQPMRGSYVVSACRRSFGFADAAIDDLFYHDCPPEARARARQNLRPEAVAPQQTRFQGSVPAGLPRAYVLCRDDHAIPLDAQSRMAEGLPQIMLPCGHSPFLAMPARLAQALRDLATDMQRPATTPFAQAPDAP